MEVTGKGLKSCARWYRRYLRIECAAGGFLGFGRFSGLTGVLPDEWQRAQGTFPSKRRSSSPWLTRWRKSYCRFGGEIEEGKRLLEIKSNMRVGVTRVADGGVLAEVKIEVAAASGHDEGTVDGGRPNDSAFDEAVDVFEDRMAVIAGFGEFGISIRAEHNGIGTIDTDKTQPA